MHGLRQIVRLNQVEQDFVDSILATPYEDTNLLEVWQQWREEQREEQLYRDIQRIEDESISLRAD